MRILSLTKKHVAEYKTHFLKYFILTLLSWALGILVPYIVGRYIDLLINIKNRESIYFYTKIILVLGVSGCFISYFKGIIFEELNRRASNSINLYLIDHIKKLPLSFFRKNNSVYIIDRINTDSYQLMSFTIIEVINLIINVITCSVLFVVMGIMNLKITLILLTFIPIYLVIYKFFKERLYTARKNFIEQQNRFVASMNQQINSVQFLKFNSLYDYMQEKIKGKFEVFLTHIIKFMKVASLHGNMNSVIDSFASVIMFLYGGIEILNGNLTIGEFTIINVYFIMLFEAIQYFTRFGGIYQRTMVSYNRTMELLGISKEQNGNVELDEVQNIKMKDVDFSYNDEDKILNKVNHSFNRGNIYSIKGFNGSGKSTMIKVMMGLEPDYRGDIYIDGIDLKEVNMYDLREKMVGIAEQEPALLNDTLRNNLILNNRRAVDDIEIGRYIEKLNLKDFMNRLENGLDTVIDENTSNISGGEKQKISLMKALLKDPKIIILDEPSSALDDKSIERMKDILVELKKDKIIIIVSHDQRLIDFSDEIITVNEFSMAG